MTPVQETGVREARARLTELLADAADGRGTVITRHGRPLAVLLPPEAVAVWQAHQARRAEPDRHRAAAEEQRSRREAWGSELVHPVAAVIRYYGNPASDDPLYLREADQVPRPRSGLRDLVEQLRPDYRAWMVEAWYEDDPCRPSPDSARFRNTARHRYDWQDLSTANVLHLLDAEGTILASAEYDGPVRIPGDPDTTT
ncbi:type II toxin-antitoxin system Phd/YefM family antitoxin [Streptomyces sp. WAC 06725]|uniref:type II toxin-antitoxin system Phd/YefM family antitoxin n=1 Tax=Streptomyces sp. WAC 06725 TaxID=2203209 RepID=UPI00163D3A56|nr:type II toxin-antitoxin system Phd/YefM family antitoxin [Streptomyces sp. WAC 06725]